MEKINPNVDLPRNRGGQINQPANKVKWRNKWIHSNRMISHPSNFISFHLAFGVWCVRSCESDAWGNNFYTEYNANFLIDMVQ